MQRRVVGLRSTLTWGALGLAGLALVAAVTVMLLTTMLHGLSAAIETSTQSVRLAEEAAVKLPRRLDAIEAALATREWLADEMFSIADLNLASVLYRGPAFGLDRWPRVADWHRRCYARPVARATVAEREAKA